MTFVIPFIFTYLGVSGHITKKVSEIKKADNPNYSLKAYWEMSKFISISNFIIVTSICLAYGLAGVSKQVFTIAPMSTLVEMIGFFQLGYMFESASNTISKISAKSSINRNNGA